MAGQTVREVCFDVLRNRGLTTLFANPGSTEVPFLVGLPDDFKFVLGLHESTVVGMATGYAIGHQRPALVLLHTTAGLGNAVGAIATARVNRAPLVIIVGQQDRRHLALEPFLAGRLQGLAGDYPLEVISPVRASDVPSSIERASLVAEQGSGPVIVIVPMGDWTEQFDKSASRAAAAVAVGPRSVPPEIDRVAAALTNANAPGIVAGSACDTDEGWRALTALAQRLDASVWIEPFGGRAGFPQTHRLYRGQLPADRPRLREALTGTDVLLVVGTAALRQYPYTEGALFPAETRLFVLTNDATEANRSPAELAIVGDLSALVDALADRVPQTSTRRDVPSSPAEAFRLPKPAQGKPLRAAHVFEALASRLADDTILLEESPSSRPALQAMIPARRPLGFVSAAMGGLGFAMPAGVGFKMALPDRPVVVIVGDGSSMYSIQSVWSAGERGTGVLFIVLANGRYAIMDNLAEQRGGEPVWPSFKQLSLTSIARGFGIEAEHIKTHSELEETLTRVCADLQARRAPLLLEVDVQPDTTLAP